MKKPFILLLLIAILFLLFSCVKRPTIIEDETDETNFFNADFFICSGSSAVDLLPEKGMSGSGDRQLQRYADTEKEFNLTLIIEKYSNAANRLFAASMSGSIHYELIMTINAELFDAAQSGLLRSVSEIIEDTSDEKWGTAGKTEQTIFNGTQYGFFCNYWDYYPDVQGFVSANWTLLEQFGLTDPHEYIENDEWNWNTFKQAITDATINDYTGLLFGNPYQISCAFIRSNGGAPYKIVNGRYVVSFTDSASIEALEYLQSLKQDGVANNDDYFFGGFKFGTSHIWACGGTIESEDFVFYSLKTPTGPHGDKNASTGVTLGTGSFWGFPNITNFSESELFTVIDYLFEPLDPYYPLGWRDYYKDNVFFNATDYETFIKQTDDVFVYNIVILNESKDEYAKAINSILSDDEKPMIALSAISDLFQSDLDNNYNK